jgi:predicted permease
MKAPWLARLLVRLGAPAGRRDDALGDLEEAHGRRIRSGVRGAAVASVVEAAVIAVALVRTRVPGIPSIGIGSTATDLRLAFRLMHRQPFLTLTAALSLAVGIGLATVGFALMEVLLFSRLPFDGGDRFVRISVQQDPQRPAAPPGFDFGLVREQATAFEHLGALSGGREYVRLTSGQEGIATIAGITPASLRYLPHAPLRGRLLVPADGEPGAAPVVMIREGYWRRSQAGAVDVVGSAMEVAGVSRTVVGVVPDAFQFPNEPDLWIPLGEPFAAGPDGGLRLFGILAPGRSLEAGQAQLSAIAGSLSSMAGGRIQLAATRFTDFGPLALTLSTAVLTVVIAVLVVIAANVGNLILARSFARSREFALRAALGASRARLVGQMFVEVLLLGAVAALLGSVSARGVLRRFNAMDEIPFWADFTGGAWTTAFVIVSAVLAAAIAGVWPALKATRRDLVAALQPGDGRASDVRFGRMAGAAIVLQVALSVVTLHGALIVAQGFAQYSRSSVSLPRNVLTTGLSLNATRRAETGTRAVRLTAAAVEDLAAGLPGVAAAGLATALPRHSPPATLIEVEPLDGETAAAPQPAPFAGVSAGFFETLAADPVDGRSFEAGDYRLGAPPVAVVNEPFVRRFFGGAAPIGRRFRAVRPGGAGPWHNVVGVVPDLGLSLGDPSFAAGYYVPLGDDADFVYLAMRVAGDPLAYSLPLRRALLARDPRLDINRMVLLEDVASDDRRFFGWFAVALVGLGAVTLVLALAGVYAMMSLAVTRRTREIGIRVALGATAPRVVRTIVGRAAWLVGLGGAIGCGLAVLSLGAREILVSRLPDGGAWTLPMVVTLLVAAGLAATWLPLQRALRVRPADALRAE